MSFEQKLRDRIKNAGFGSVEKNVLRVVLGDVQLKAAKSKINDEACYGIVKKIVQGNKDSIGYMAMDDPRKSQYEQENVILSSLLPEYLTADQIRGKLTPELIEQVKSSKNDGQCVGLVMSYLKKENLLVEGETVKEVVKLLRT